MYGYSSWLFSQLTVHNGAIFKSAKLIPYSNSNIKLLFICNENPLPCRGFNPGLPLSEYMKPMTNHVPFLFLVNWLPDTLVIVLFVFQVYKCSYCSKRFASNGLRNKHIKFNHELQYTCEQCNKKFPTRHTLMSHTRMHTGEKVKYIDGCRGVDS